VVDLLRRASSCYFSRAPIVFRMSRAETASYVAMEPAIHVFFSVFVGWHDYMPWFCVRSFGIWCTGLSLQTESIRQRCAYNDRGGRLQDPRTMRVVPDTRDAAVHHVETNDRSWRKSISGFALHDNDHWLSVDFAD
jgi:hypothetical protein